MTLMFLGGICFDPMVSILLSMAGLFISETLVYLFSRKFASEKRLNYWKINILT